MLSKLNQPFPAHSLRGSFRMAAIIGLFVAAFLLIFQPFGLRGMPGGWPKTAIICGYGLVSFTGVSVSALVFSEFFPARLKAASWTVGKEISITLFNFLLIGLLNTLYTFFIFGDPFSLKYLLFFEVITLAVGILPVSLIVLWRYNRLLHANLKLAREMNSELKPAVLIPEHHAGPDTFSEPVIAAESHTFTFSSETGTDSITLAYADFLYATAADNYVEIHYTESNQPKKNLIRNTLTRLEETVAGLPKLVRCHRAYLVNLGQVRNFSGNAQGLKLELFHTPEIIPVSRKMVPVIKSLLPG